MTYGWPVLLDTSAWARILLDRVEGLERERFDAAVRAAEVVVCEPFLLEALYSAQSLGDYRRLEARLGALPRASSPATLMASTLAAQGSLAASPGISHRVKVVDLMIAVIADHHGFGILHYDHDYDVIAAHCGLTCPSVWIATRGSLV